MVFCLGTQLSWFGLSGLYEFITFCSDLRLGWGLKQTCSSRWELSNNVLHSLCTHQGRVDSWLLMVESQTTSLTPGPSFCHNLCCRCPNGSCKTIFDIYTSINFNDMKKSSMQGVLTPAIELWSFKSPGGLPSPHFGSVNVILTLYQKWVATNVKYSSPQFWPSNKPTLIQTSLYPEALHDYSH